MSAVDWFSDEDVVNGFQIKSPLHFRLTTIHAETVEEIYLHFCNKTFLRNMTLDMAGTVVPLAVFLLG